MRVTPAPDDVQLLLSSWLARREAEEAPAEDFLFRAPEPNRGERHGFYTAVQRSRAWRALPADLKPCMTWYEGTRHSFTSGKLDAGVSLDEVSQALGHSSPVVTQRFYNRFIRKTFSKAMLGGLKLTDAKVLPFKKAVGDC